VEQAPSKYLITVSVFDQSPLAMICGKLAQKLSRIGGCGGSNLDANSLQSGSVLGAIQQAE
jgi:hypothetical protein